MITGWRPCRLNHKSLIYLAIDVTDIKNILTNSDLYIFATGMCS